MTGYCEVPVHDNVNLNNPGELAWVVEDIIEDEPEEYVRGVFHTREEAEQFGEEYVEEVRQEGLRKTGTEWFAEVLVSEIRVEYAAEELDAEEEAKEKERKRWI